MNKLCEQCKDKGVSMGSLRFCSMKCRNAWVSGLMINKAANNKKEYGNAYYVKKKQV